jgi:hypothetical protein
MQKDILRALETGLAVRQKTETEVVKQEADLRARIEKLTELQKLIQNYLAAI